MPRTIALIMVMRQKTGHERAKYAFMPRTIALIMVMRQITGHGRIFSPLMPQFYTFLHVTVLGKLVSMEAFTSTTKNK